MTCVEGLPSCGVQTVRNCFNRLSLSSKQIDKDIVVYAIEGYSLSIVDFRGLKSGVVRWTLFFTPEIGRADERLFPAENCSMAEGIF